MTRVSFYVLGSTHADPLPFVCRLVERIYRERQPVFIHGPEETAARLDELLWTFSPGSFLPHERCADDAVGTAPILLGAGAPPAGPREVLINLAADVPEFFSSFSRCVELVAGNEAQRAASRARYRFYRDRGYELDSHSID